MIESTQGSIDNDGTIHHKGETNGYLYRVDEELNEGDYKVHEACDKDDPWELVTTRKLKVRLIRETEI